MRHVLLSLLALGSCRHAAAPDEAPVTWVLVDRPYGTLADARAGDATIAPDASAWVLEPVKAERSPFACPHTLRLRSSTTGTMCVGELVEVEITLEGAPRCEHEIEIVPTRPGVRIERSSRITVKPGAVVRIRFTAHSHGTGGIGARVLSCRRVD